MSKDAVSPAASAPTPARPQTATEVRAIIAGLPRYYTVRDLQESLGRAALVEAYVQGWLPEEAQRLLEERPEKLLCLLVAQLLSRDQAAR